MRLSTSISLGEEEIDESKSERARGLIFGRILVSVKASQSNKVLWAEEVKKVASGGG